MHRFASGVLVASVLACAVAAAPAAAGEYGYYSGGDTRYSTYSKCCYRKVVRKAVTYQRVRPHDDYGYRRPHRSSYDDDGYRYRSYPRYRSSYDDGGYRYRSYPRYRYRDDYSDGYRNRRPVTYRNYDEGYRSSYRPRYSEPYRYPRYDGDYRPRYHDDGGYRRPYQGYQSYGGDHDD